MLTRRFDDFDAFAGSVSDVECQMMLQNPVHREWTISLVNLCGLDVQLGRLGSGNIVEGQSWSDGYLLYMPLTDDCEYSANGVAIPKNSFMALEPGCEFCISTKVEHDWCSLFMPIDMLAGERNDELQPSDSANARCRVIPASRGIANRFRDVVGQIMTAAAANADFEASPSGACAAAELLSIGAAVVEGRQTLEGKATGRPSVSRREILRRSQRLIEERGDRLVGVRELAAVAEVSERTLRSAFTEYFGVGPVRYLQLRRLHLVRNSLKSADPDVSSVSDILLQHGEWEFSRFALRYRQLFGERPSQTLRMT